MCMFNVMIIMIMIIIIMRSGTDFISLLSLLLFLLLGQLSSKKPKTPLFQSSSKSASVDRVGFRTRHYNLKMAALTSFHQKA